MKCDVTPQALLIQPCNLPGSLTSQFLRLRPRLPEVFLQRRKITRAACCRIRFIFSMEGYSLNMLLFCQHWWLYSQLVWNWRQRTTLWPYWLQCCRVCRRRSARSWKCNATMIKIRLITKTIGEVLFTSTGLQELHIIIFGFKKQ